MIPDNVKNNLYIYLLKKYLNILCCTRNLYKWTVFFFTDRFVWMILLKLIWKLFHYEWNVLSDFSQKVMGMIWGFSFNEKSSDTYFVHLA